MDLGTLFAKIKLDSTEFEKSVNKVTGSLSGLTAASAAAGVAIAALFAGATAEGLRFAAQLEQLQMGFSTLLGSSGEADKFIKSMQEFAARTPFQFEDVAQGSRRLMAMGIEAEHTLPLMSAIGDRVSAMGGGAFEIQRVITALGQMNAKTRVATQEINQLTEVGISGFGILAKELGKTVPEVIAMVEAREIDSATFLKAFMHTTAAEVGGMMERQSQTLIGLVSTLKDRISIGLGDAAEPMLQPLKDAIPVVTDFVSNLIVAVGPLISALGGVVSAGAQVLSWFNALDASTQKLVLALGTMATIFPAVLGGALALSAGIAGAVAALAPYATTVAAIFSPAAFGPLLLAVAAISAAVGGFFAAFSHEGEGAVDTIVRVAGAIAEALAPSIASAQMAGEAFLQGFGLGWASLPVSIEYVAESVRAVTDSILSMVSQVTGTSLGADTWAVLGGWVAKIGKYLLVLGGDVLALVMDMLVGATAMFQPLIASMIVFGEGLFGLVTGTMDVKTAFKKMGIGILGELASVLNAVVVASVITIATVADAAALAMDAVGLDQYSSGLKAASADMRGAASSLSEDLVSALLGGNEFNMELEATTETTVGFNSVLADASTGLADYAHSLDGLSGVLDGITAKHGGGKKPDTKEENPPKFEPVVNVDGFDALMAGMGALVAPGDLFGNAESAISTGARNLMHEVMDATMGGHGPLTPEDAKRFNNALASLAANLAAFKPEQQETVQTNTKGLSGDGSGIGGGKFDKDGFDYSAFQQGLLDSIAAMDEFKGAIKDKLMGGLGKLDTLIDSTVSGFQSGGVWGALIAALVELLINSETMANIAKTLDDAFGEIADTFGILLNGVHLVVGNALLLVADIVSGLAPALEFISDVVGGLSPLLIALGTIFGVLMSTLQPIFGILEIIAPLISKVFQLLYIAMQGVGIIILGIVWAIQKLWNGLLSAIIAVLEGLSTVFKGLDGAIESLEGLKANTNETEAAMSALMNTTYDTALAQAEQNVATSEVTESLDAMNAALVNVPAGYKLALARFEAMAGERGGVGALAVGDSAIMGTTIPALASGGVTLGPTLALIGEKGPEAVIPLDQLGNIGGGRSVVITGNIYVTTDDPEGFLDQIERIAQQRNFRRTGSLVAAHTPFSVGRR